jgi:hypothetical protein
MVISFVCEVWIKKKKKSKGIAGQSFEVVGYYIIRLGVESEYYSNSLRKLRGLTLWDKILNFLKKLNKI